MLDYPWFHCITQLNRKMKRKPGKCLMSVLKCMHLYAMLLYMIVIVQRKFAEEELWNIPDASPVAWEIIQILLSYKRHKILLQKLSRNGHKPHKQIQSSCLIHDGVPSYWYTFYIWSPKQLWCYLWRNAYIFFYESALWESFSCLKERSPLSRRLHLKLQHFKTRIPVFVQ